ncbi:MAG TPA: hypothetical protein VHC21_04350 [Candidatus Saccharimonadales bacterium]|nr:hypothetical protein [Candidatus Saccharimonadales bacterium]
MSCETIGFSAKNPTGPIATQPDGSEIKGLRFEIPYGEDEYGILLTNIDMEMLLHRKYETIVGARRGIEQAFTVDLEMPDLPLFAWAASLSIEATPGYTPSVSMGVAVATQSRVHAHRGMLLARRHGSKRLGDWECIRYDEEPALPYIEDSIVSADDRAAGSQAAA